MSYPSPPQQYYTDTGTPAPQPRYPLPYRIADHPLTLLDLRAQILANALTLLPDIHGARSSTDHLEVAVARFLPSSATSPQGHKYYAMLIRRQPSRDARSGSEILVKGKPQGSEVAALEWLLRDSEERVHGFAQEKAREGVGQQKGECGVM